MKCSLSEAWQVQTRRSLCEDPGNAASLVSFGRKVQAMVNLGRHCGFPTEKQMIVHRGYSTFFSVAQLPTKGAVFPPATKGPEVTPIGVDDSLAKF